MLPTDADPVLRELQQLSGEARRVRRALRSAESAHRTALASELEALLRRTAELRSSEAHGALVDDALDARARSLRVAAEARLADRRTAERRRQADDLVARAIADGRPLTAGEQRTVRSLLGTGTGTDRDAGSDRDLDPARDQNDAVWHRSITTERVRDDVLEALGTVALRDARRQLRTGLLMTDQMRRIIAEATPAMLRGDPILLVGETGGAKTALAEHLSRAAIGRDPELISGYGDITSAQVIGSHELRAEGGATSSVFVAGPLLRAMAEGRPVILDEVNAMPPEFLKRLNRILQLRPGDTLAVQEDAGRAVRIAPGFVILATANEQTPHRYRGLDRLSAELVNRFGANSYRVHYPDAARDYADFPAENALLAAAAIADDRGELPPELPVDALHRVARAAFISQQVFAGAHGEGFDAFVSTEREIDGRPGLEESVLAPRTLVALLQKVADSAGTVTLDRALTRFVEGVMHREDRRVLALIIEGQGFRIR
ncbi:AAA family ATPase [Leucobacter rhizosphaerae]|uniref:AAA family ATPase n=1 Tax=Leucobacter rhizosphaerae TaxID=2932245 RepID=A0ABY4FWY5_9MICO|nr:AAA family ATPase [Leucobacter rhizosphaerae]UOQ60815.1 AAA family ATPase [Leucobacter rhizosphaerae]